MLFELYALALLISENNTTLLLQRASTQSFAPNLYSIVGGKVESHERALHAIRREVLEEVNLDIPESHFTLAHTLHRMGEEGAFIMLVFKTDISTLPKPRNNEPKKHTDMRFFSLDNLPSDIIPAHKHAIEYIQLNKPYSEHGWGNNIKK